MTTIILNIPIQTQGQPISSKDACFPVEPDAVALMCTEGPESGGQEANSTS